MIPDEVKQEILERLPQWIEEDAGFRLNLVRMLRGDFAEKQQTESRFDRLLDELRRDREANERKWEESKAESDRKWEEQSKKWEENRQEFNRVHEEIMAMVKRHDRTVGALGSRWGLSSERSFRNALAGILRGFFGVQVVNINEFDDSGEVFGRPDQIELDIVIRNGTLLILELKSSMSKSEMYIFERKARWYEKRHQCKADRLIAVSPMVDAKAMQVAQNLGIEVYSDAEDVPAGVE